MARGFGCQIIYSAPRRRFAAEDELESQSNNRAGAMYVPLDKLLKRSDIISVHCPLNTETVGLFDKENFAKMKSTAVFVNTSRGPVVNQDDLFDALKQGVIAAAGLDVTVPEPLPIHSPLLTLPNCIILPHIASATLPTRTKMAQIAVDNLLAGVDRKYLPFDYVRATKRSA
eukprot:TRINITY_DN1581_c0_g1_i3.p1 TRINITY_DN1581_c0_g1~~TRINITY_DN1581_c0_g1_i3.p1  ORF type:complete len:172 (+),score=21.64 TRINITY_DN1581_c0_g1_i3:142-657(+)